MTKSIRVTYLVLATSNTKWTSKKKLKNISLSKTLNMMVFTVWPENQEIHELINQLFLTTISTYIA